TAFAIASQTDPCRPIAMADPILVCYYSTYEFLIGARTTWSRPDSQSTPAANKGCVLRELRIENLLLIEKAALRLGEGLNAITGETGAGKTILSRSLDLLMGGKAKAQIVRLGAEEAWVEGVFDLPAGLIDEPEFTELAERLPEGGGGGGL